MRWVDLTLAVRTPLFIGAAGPPKTGDDIEIIFPVPSLRGTLRYWLRALVGSHLTHDGDGLAALADIERSVFGAASRDEPARDEPASDSGGGAAPGGSRRSQSAVAVRPRGRVPFVPPGGRQPWMGTDIRVPYLLGQGLWFRDAALRQWRLAGHVPAGAQMRFAVRLDPRAPHPQACADLFCCALWALTTFGGLGARARRGFGTVQVTASPALPTSDCFDLAWLTEPPTSPDIGPRLADVLDCTRQAMAVLNPAIDVQPPAQAAVGTGADADAETNADADADAETNANAESRTDAGTGTPPRYPCLRPGSYVVRHVALPVAGLTSGLDDALADTGGALRTFRVGGTDRNRTFEYEEMVEPWLDGNSPDPEAVFVNAGLGLPVVFTRKSDGRTATVTPRQGDTVRGKELRRASPLWLRVYPDPTGHWHRRSLAFLAEWLPDGAHLWVGSPGREGPDAIRLEQPTQQEVEDLLRDWPG